MPKANEGDVNEISETIIPKEGEEGDDTQIVPILEKEPTQEEIEELKSGAKSSPAPEEPLEELPEEPLALKQPKPVEGESPRELILRKQIEVLREKIRGKEELIKSTPTPITNEEYEQLKEVYSEEEIKQLEVVFDVIGKKKGYVKSDELYVQSGNETLDSFIDTHPEYKPANDLEDVRWNTFKRILQQDYNLAGKPTKELTRIFEKVHRDVAEEFGETPSKGVTPAQRNAQIQKIKSVSHAGGIKSEPQRKSNAPTDPTVRKMFKDFEDSDF